MKNLLFAFITAALFMVSCADDITVDVINNPGTGSGSGSGGSNDFGYFYPLEVGNFWDYSITSTQVSAPISFRTEIISSENRNDSTIYIGASTYDGQTSEAEMYYINRLGWSAANDTESLSGANIENLSIIALDDNLSVGQSWEYVIETEALGIMTTNRYVNTVSEILDSYTVNGTEFTDVKKISQDIFTSSDLLPQELQLFTTDYFWAAEVGFVETIAYNSVVTPLEEVSRVSITGYSVN